MNIPPDKRQKASGSIVQDDDGRLWRIIGFIDQPTVILDPIKEIGKHADTRQRAYQVMGSETSQRFHQLVRDLAA